MTQLGIRMPSDQNPAARVERYKEPAPEIRFLSLSQIDEQLEVLRDRPQLQVMVAVLIYGGLRREELLWLTPEDFDGTAGARGILRIRAKTVDGLSWQPKTRKNRAVPVSSRLRLFLDSWELKRPKDARWLFPSPKGNRWDTDNFSADLREVNRAAQLPWGCLDYRHTFGSQLAMKGESLYKISSIMGNSPEICRRHYAALLPEALVESVEFPSTGTERAAAVV
jgi:integrase